MLALILLIAACSMDSTDSTIETPDFRLTMVERQIMEGETVEIRPDGHIWMVSWCEDVNVGKDGTSYRCRDMSVSYELRNGYLCSTGDSQWGPCSITLMQGAGGDLFVAYLSY